jgi:hypothetical protein
MRVSALLYTYRKFALAGVAEGGRGVVGSLGRGGGFVEAYHSAEAVGYG